jgi:hypothetical protein
MYGGTIDNRNERVRAYFPVLIFIALIFLLEVFGLQKATSLVVSVFVSLFILGVMSAHKRQKIGDRPEFKKFQYYFGILSFLFILIIFVAFLHWYQIGHINLRWILFFLVLLTFFIFLFRAVHILDKIKPGGSNISRKD